MRSYAQNFEDVRLERIFADQAEGFYIDVGAADPVEHSVTKHFYDRGWRGINVEPNEAFLRRLCEQRPRDVNLGVAASDQPGVLQLYERVDELDGCSTVSRAAADTVEEMLGGTRPRSIEATTLAAICEEHVTGAIDFLKIDVEAHEREVIAGADFTRWRPRVLIVEATWPLTTRTVHEDWEPLLLAAGYVVAVFDGLNRWYVRDDEAEELVPRLAVPISPFDDYDLDRYARRIERLHEEVAQLRAERAQELARHQQRIVHLEDAIARLGADMEAVRAEQRAAEQDAAHWRRLYESRVAQSLRVPSQVASAMREAAKRVRRSGD